MTKNVIRITSFLTLAAFLAVPLFVSAAVVTPPAAPNGTPTFFGSCSNVGCFAKNIITVLLAAVFSVAVVFLVIGGFRYIISQGNEEGVEKAKGTITNAIIGIVVVLLAWIILQVIYNLLESGTQGA